METDPTEIINDVFEGVSTRRDFDIPDKTPTNFSVLDIFAIPEWCLSTEKNFLEWFESRFFPLDEAGCSYFSELSQEAIRVLDKHPYLLSPQKEKAFSLSKGIRNEVNRGFPTSKKIRSFLKRVATKNTPENITLFISPDRNSRRGAEKLSTCRVLSIAYLLEKIRVSEQFCDFIKNLNFILGKEKNPVAGSKESGILSGLQLTGDHSLLEDLEGFSPEKILEWVEKGTTFHNVILNINGRLHTIPKLHIGIKGGIRTFLKFLRKAEEEFKPMGDLFRIRFVFGDGTSKYDILEVLHDVQEEAKKKEFPQIETEFEEKNYFSSKEINEFFPKSLGIRCEGDANFPLRGGILDQIKIDENSSSGAKFKSLSAVVRMKNESGDTCFAFEIQCLRESEYRTNEREKTPQAHFIYKFRQLCEVISRENGKMTEKEIINAIAAFLKDPECSPPDKMPDKITEGIDFLGTPEEKAKLLFDLLKEEGVLDSVHQSFPSPDAPTKGASEKSPYFIHREVKARISAILNAEFQVTTVRGQGAV